MVSFAKSTSDCPTISANSEVVVREALYSLFAVVAVFAASAATPYACCSCCLTTSKILSESMSFGSIFNHSANCFFRSSSLAVFSAILLASAVI